MTEQQQIYTTPSGLGGAFTVRIMHELERDEVLVAVEMPNNPDWHDYRFVTKRDRLKPVQERAS